MVQLGLHDVLFCLGKAWLMPVVPVSPLWPGAHQGGSKAWFLRTLSLELSWSEFRIHLFHYSSCQHVTHGGVCVFQKTGGGCGTFFLVSI